MYLDYQSIYSSNNYMFPILWSEFAQPSFVNNVRTKGFVYWPELFGLQT